MWRRVLFRWDSVWSRYCKNAQLEFISDYSMTFWCSTPSHMLPISIQTCNFCCSGHYEWWDGKAGHHCGVEPCWPPGTVCGPGTTVRHLLRWILVCTLLETDISHSLTHLYQMTVTYLIPVRSYQCSNCCNGSSWFNCI